MRWTDKERNILRDYYYILSPAELSKLLPNRSRQAITSQVHYLRKRGWAFAERYKK